jgi:hypothetical protein
MPVAQIVLHVQPQMHVVPLILITGGIVLMLAYLSWELVERPALRLRHTLLAPLIAAEAAADVVPVTVSVGPRPADSGAAIEPGVAHVWRPMSAGQKVRIVPDGGTAPVMTTSVAAAVLPAGVRSRPMPVAAAIDDQDVPAIAISAGRMALATKRQVASTLPLFDDDVTGAVRTPSRAVQLMPDTDDAQAAGRMSRPRPNWSRPMAAGKPIHL